MPGKVFYNFLLCSIILFYRIFTIPGKTFYYTNGLPSNGIKGLQGDDSVGCLWIATEAGVVRYNGISFKTFDQFFKQ